jgi:hypothetical protein
MTAAEIIEFASGLPDVAAITAHEGDGSPEVAWGDTFIYYGENRKMPWATIVTKDYEGWDEASNLNRPDVFRLNVSVGRDEVPPADGVDFAALDVLLPHPAYATQGWVCILNPSDPRDLLTRAHARASRKAGA